LLFSNIRNRQGLGFITAFAKRPGRGARKFRASQTAIRVLLSEKETTSLGFAAPHYRGASTMRKLILPALLAAAVAFAFVPSQAKAGGFSVSINPGPVYVAPVYPYPVYSGYYAPPVYYTPSYYPYVYSNYGYSPYYRHEWREHEEHEWHEHHGHDGWEHHRH
jgi:hypothetical protein